MQSDVGSLGKGDFIPPDEDDSKSPSVRLRPKKTSDDGDPTGAARVASVPHLKQTEGPKLTPLVTEQKATGSRRQSCTTNLDKNLSLFKYLNAELTRGYFLQHDEAKYEQKRERVYTFFKIQKEVEKMMWYGFFLCMDAFLFLFTFLPMRVSIALVKIFIGPCQVQRGGRWLEPAQMCDLLKGFILIACSWLLYYIDISMLYHIVRGQAMIKLYIIYNMLEVADRLFSSFGQDILDALFWTATEPKNKKREHFGIIPHLGLAIIYVFLHAILVLFQATTLNVAFNSHTKALLTIMMSNNFVELKGSVFKKFEKRNLYQMSCADIRERYHYLVLLSIVVLRNMTEFSWNPEHFKKLIPDLLLVLAGEVLVDWVKHAFITKFNCISAEVYVEYRASLAYDMVSSRKKTAYSDHIDLVSRSGIRIFTQSFKITGISSVVILILFYISITLLKILNSIVLLGKGCQYVKDFKLDEPPSAQNTRASSNFASLNRDTSQSTPNLYRDPQSPGLVPSDSSVSLAGSDLVLNSRDTKPHSAKKVQIQNNKSLSDIDRYTLCSNQIV
ncbi:transmembrane anterior posterior transformation protein 1 homolog [Anneissia japonica]|uniref:transmembrane anterior posterior transformation protein 1 homolog n=1 Tax=Anneissia japonica TaxID=1529436 RepID=UPI0014258BC7|nr:transmembrane anterior posterior transformation protein 1 homolog [Anneissia japonica]